MEFQILGPLEVIDDGRELSIRGRKLQALLVGIGLATAIFLDATLIRMVLVPRRHAAARQSQLVDPELVGADPAATGRRAGGARDRAGTPLRIKRHRSLGQYLNTCSYELK